MISPHEPPLQASSSSIPRLRIWYQTGFKPVISFQGLNFQKKKCKSMRYRFEKSYLFLLNLVSHTPMPGGGGYSTKIRVGMSGALVKTLTLFQTKLCNFPCPVSNLTQSSLPYFRPDVHSRTCSQLRRNCFGLRIHLRRALNSLWRHAYLLQGSTPPGLLCKGP